MRKDKSQGPLTEKQADKILKLLQQESALTRPRLRRLLSEGEDTAELRAEICALERRIDDARLTLEALAEQRESQTAEACAAEARQIAQEFAAKLEALMARLQPPEHPTKRIDQ